MQELRIELQKLVAENYGKVDELWDCNQPVEWDSLLVIQAMVLIAEKTGNSVDFHFIRRVETLAQLISELTQLKTKACAVQ